MCKQSARRLLMIEPVSFDYNKETAINNYFQIYDKVGSNLIQKRALIEFENLISMLRKHDVEVITFKDTIAQHTPDSIFPNNWVSFHENATIVIYPMYAPNRRKERRFDIFDTIYNSSKYQVIDISAYENYNLYLEGTGSMVLDRHNKIAFASLSARTDIELLNIFCNKMEYTSVAFKSYQDFRCNHPVYHTNVMMSICEDFVILCQEAIPCFSDITKIHSKLLNKQIINITIKQMNSYAGNVLQVENKWGDSILVISKNAYESLNTCQILEIKKYCKILVADVSTIEKYGGGGVRCMIAEIF